MFTPTRDQARRFLTDAWARYRSQTPLSALESIAASLVAMHPEYHAFIEDPAHNLDRDFHPEAGDVNPFLHLSLHLAVAEQIAIDQPPGIRAQFERLRSAKGDEHAALHAVLDCLDDVIRHAQRHQAPLDGSRYLECLARQ